MRAGGVLTSWVRTRVSEKFTLVGPGDGCGNFQIFQAGGGRGTLAMDESCRPRLQLQEKAQTVELALIREKLEPP